MEKIKTRTILSMAFLITAFLTGITNAGPVYVPLTATDFDDLLGGQATAIGAALEADFSVNNLSAEVISQAFGDGEGNYAYLYQINNTGTTGNDIITRFTITPFLEADSNTSLGYLTANVPSVFELGDRPPLGAEVDTVTGPTIGFDFPTANPEYGVPDGYIAPGESSNVLYVESNLSPDVIVGNVINGSVHYNDIVGPVPEPASLALLLFGTVGLIKKSTVKG